MTAPTIQRDAAFPAYAAFRNGDIEVIAAPAPSPETLAYISEQIRHASSYRYLTKCAQGMGFPSVTDALAKLAANLAAEPVAYVTADAIEAHKDAPDRIRASLFTAPLAGRVGVFLAPPASSDLFTAAKALATRYLKAQHDDASLCVNAAHHKAVCDLFAEIERAGKGGVSV
jgi:hypothetical protein